MSSSAAIPERCERFRLDYYTDENHRHRPEHRYCVCGLTEAHHLTENGS